MNDIVVSNDCQSELKLDRLYVENISFHNAGFNGETKLTLNFEKKMEIDLTENKAVVCLGAIINSETDALSISVSLIGHFRFNADSRDEQLIKEVLSRNTISIMFPYLRSQISLLTTQPGLSPIIIPPINVNALLNSKD